MKEDTKAMLIVGGIFAFLLFIPAVLADTTKRTTEENKNS